MLDIQREFHLTLWMVFGNFKEFHLECLLELFSNFKEFHLAVGSSESVPTANETISATFLSNGCRGTTFLYSRLARRF